MSILSGQNLKFWLFSVAFCALATFALALNWLLLQRSTKRPQIEKLLILFRSPEAQNPFKLAPPSVEEDREFRSVFGRKKGQLFLHPAHATKAGEKTQGRKNPKTWKSPTFSSHYSCYHIMRGIFRAHAGMNNSWEISSEGRWHKCLFARDD